MSLGALDRDRLLESLRSIGVNTPESCCENLSDEAVSGVLRWYRHATQRGQHVSSSQVAYKLLNGGLEGFGEVEPLSARSWYATRHGRRTWIWRELRDLDPVYVEAAIITLVQSKQEPTKNLVRRYALLAEKQQHDYDELITERAKKLRALLKEQRELGTATGGMKKVDGLKAVQ